MKNPPFDHEQIEQLQRLLLHPDFENVEIGLLTLQAVQAERLPAELLAPANMLAQLLPANYERIKSLAAEILRAQNAHSTHRQPLNEAAFEEQLQIFRIAQSNTPLAWKRAYKRFEKHRAAYEPLFLMYPRWRQIYRELMKLFYHYAEVRKAISYCDALLKNEPDDFFLNNYRFNSVNYMLEQGEGQEELPRQVQWLQRWHELYPNSSCMIYTLLGVLYSQHYADGKTAERYYRLALEEHTRSRWDNYAAMSANNLACLLIQRGEPLAEAFALATQANELQKAHSAYLETLAYLLWKHKRDHAAAAAQFRLALQAEPSNLVARAHLAELLLKHNPAALEESEEHFLYILRLPLSDILPKYHRQLRQSILQSLRLLPPTHEFIAPLKNLYAQIPEK